MVNTKNSVFFIFFLLGFLTSGGQNCSGNYCPDDKHHMLSGGVGYQKSLILNVNYSRGTFKNLSNGITFGMRAWSLGAEGNFCGGDENYALKGGYEYVWIWILAAKAEAICYFDKSGNYDFRFTPEIGLSMVGVLNLHYGYNIPVAGTEMKSIGKHRIILSLNIPLGFDK